MSVSSVFSIARNPSRFLTIPLIVASLIYKVLKRGPRGFFRYRSYFLVLVALSMALSVQ